METLLQDVRYSVRTLVKSPGFTAVAVLALALGIGANTAVFTVVDAALLRPLPYDEPDRLVHLWETKLQDQFSQHEASYPDFLDWQENTRSFEGLAGYMDGGSVTLAGRDEPERIKATVVTPNFFDLLGAAPILGRTFQPEDAQRGAEPTVVLSYGLWQRHFGGDPGALGQTLAFNGTSYRVVGVLPAGFRFAKVGEVEAWGALVPSERQLARRNLYWLKIIARLAPDVTLEQAQAEMSREAGRLASEYPDSHTGIDIAVVPLHDEIVGRAKPILIALLGAVAFVLLIACANVANLLLARSAARQKEIAVRAALGAGRRRIARQLLTESFVLARAGGAAGLLLARWGVDLLVAAVPGSLISSMPYLRDLAIDWTALGFTLAVSVATGLVFGLAPAVQVSKPDLLEALKEGGRAVPGPGRSRLRNALVVSEIALALVLLVGAGLMAESFARMMQVDPGFDPENVLAVQVPLASEKYSEPNHVHAFHRQLRERLEALPGVKGVGLVDLVPIAGGGGNTGSFSVKGRPAPAPGEEIEANVRTISPNYFDVMRVPLVRGRAFDERDSAGAPAVLVNRTLAARAFGDLDPVGQSITFDFDPQRTPYEIVGVVGDEKVGSLDASTTPVIYFSALQDTPQYASVVVRTAGDPEKLVGAVRSEVRALDPTLALGTTVTMEDAIADSPSAFLRRYPALLAGALAAVALLLAVVGIYGVISYTVAQRTHEIGVRVALGAGRGDIYRLVIRQGMVLALAGVGAGTLAALGLTRFLSGLLFGVSATNPVTFSGVAVLLMAVALLACYVPARRASRVDPMVALRYE
jgi:putative ABC transport system permease protein